MTASWSCNLNHDRESNDDGRTQRGQGLYIHPMTFLCFVVKVRSVE